MPNKAVLAFFATLLLAGSPSAASNFPSRPMQIVVPFTAGGNTDTIARLLAEHMQDSFKQSVTVVNRPGAGTNIGAGSVANSEPDGYTMLLNAPASFVVNQFIYNTLPYNPDTAFAPVCLAARFPNVLVVHPSVGVKTIQELIDKAKANPGKIEYAIAGIGATSHLSAALFAEMAGLNMVSVPYKGTSQSLPDLVAGRVAFTIDNLGPILPFIQSGKLIALGVSTKEPVALLPGVPPIATVLKGYELSSWNVLAVPAKTPKEAVDILSKECDRIVHIPKVAETMRSFGSEPVGGTSEQTAEFLKSERPRWEAAIKAAKIPKQ
ncbi:MAG TPA: tripartite tricarboxylate transporter substrate binding protein [Pseudolabrys sp.]|nr:tripartite tricarboxylate transporter substrate binding protein [Pseudolabrys sp.]